MKYQEGDFEATHLTPVWRDQANFVFVAHLGAKHGKSEWEQLWGRKVSSHRFVVCCIPFFAKDISIGDEVETDADFVFTRVVRQSGQVTFRVWFSVQSATNRLEIVNEIESRKPLMEWSSENLLALSVPEYEAQGLANYLSVREQQGAIQYETGRS